MIPINSYDIKTITSAQIRAARALLNWSGALLAKRAQVGVATVRRLEADDGVTKANPSTVKALADTLTSAGIEFTGNPKVNPGVTLHEHRRLES